MSAAPRGGAMPTNRLLSWELSKNISPLMVVFVAYGNSRSNRKAQCGTSVGQPRHCYHFPQLRVTPRIGWKPKFLAATVAAAVVVGASIRFSSMLMAGRTKNSAFKLSRVLSTKRLSICQCCPFMWDKITCSRKWVSSPVKNSKANLVIINSVMQRDLFHSFNEVVDGTEPAL